MKDKFLNFFSTLNKDEQQILLVLSVVYAPIVQSNLQILLRSLACIEPKKLALIDLHLREKLQQSGMIIVTSDGWQCNRKVAEHITRVAVNEPWFNKLAQHLIAQPSYYYPTRVDIYHAIKQLRIFLYQENVVAFAANIEHFYNSYPQHFTEVMNDIFFNQYNSSWFSALPDAIKSAVLKYYLKDSYFYLIDDSFQYKLLESFFGKKRPANRDIIHALLSERLVRGNFKDAEAWLAGDYTFEGLKLLGTLRFLENKNDEAIVYFQTALKVLKKETGKRNIVIEGLEGYFYNLALLKSRQLPNLQLQRQQLKLAIKQGDLNPFNGLSLMLLELLDIYQGKSSIEQSVFLMTNKTSAYEHLFQGLLLFWLNELDAITLGESNNAYVMQLAEYCQKAKQLNYGWYACISAALLERLGHVDEACQLMAQNSTDLPFAELINLLPQVSSWQRALDALNQLTTQVDPDDVKELRIIWSIRLHKDNVILEPKEQRLGIGGKWTKGRVIPLKKLLNAIDEFDYLSEQDKRICAHIQIVKETDYYGYAAREKYVLSNVAISEAVGHPAIFWAHQEQYDHPVDIRLLEPQLLVREVEDKLHISLLPPINQEKIIAHKTANNGLQIYAINDSHRQVAEILGQTGLIVPQSARQQVIDSIASISSMLTVQSDIGGSSDLATTVASDSRLHIHLQPMGQGIQIDIFVQPFVEGGPLYIPCTGGMTVLAEIDSKQYQTTRDFDLENQYLVQVLDKCPQLYAAKEPRWKLDDAETSLETLLQLQELGEFAILEWPKDKKIKLSREVGLSSVQFSVRKEKDWFSVEGDIEVDNGQVLDMQRLMNLLNGSTSRFLQLEDGQIIALTRELRQRLDDLTGIGEVHKDKVRFHPLAALALDEITSGMAVTASVPWTDQLNRLNEMGDLNPKPPSTLQGELRDYQYEGYQWMMRLAHWGAGACLADDMGLGKTIQAIALILARAPNGPTLILAPTSVCINWLEEIQRFAPTLNVSQFGVGDRQEMLDTAGPFDLIVCSYGLLQTESERLVDKHWHTLVADEAHAIKNALTKRSKAAMALQADFKLITTGTPIENHLGELWNLFNFINPGLLGTLQKFNQRYAQAIENNKDHELQQRLRKLLRPFILRRLKNDVLTELPSRTEVTLHIELSAEERAFYEALRRNAMDALLSSNEKAEHKQLKILAEIMKLRRACCHPSLVMEESVLSSSKLQAFEELVDELIANKHKALVFSQFVGHLGIIRRLLDKKGISYHYLDGSTPVPKRKIAVNAFQAGDGDLFLISLKAGGTGLNLTAADYVIHMDPWWNPAVEDQASDRAHRMGQLRPVTVYRLVAKDTIEDKIVELHKHKRDLASSLLEGGEVSGKMSVEQMLELIKDIV